MMLFLYADYPSLQQANTLKNATKDRRNVKQVSQQSGQATGWRTGRRLSALQNVSLSHKVLTCTTAHPLSCPMFTKVLSLEVKRPGREAHHSPSSSDKVNNAWSFTSAPPYVHTECCLIKQQGQIYRYKYAVLWFPPDDGATVISVYYRTRSVHMRALHLPFLPSPLRLVPGLCDVCLPSPI